MRDAAPLAAGENGHSSMPSLRARKARGKLVQAVADEFVDAFVSAAGLQAHVSVYFHVIKCHLSQFVELYGNPMDYSAQGSEHCHVLTKYAMKQQTNKKTDQRVEQALRAVAFLMYYQKQHPSTKGMGTKRKRSDSNQEEDARKEERSQEVIGIAEECAARRVSDIEEDDDEVDEGRRPDEAESDDDDDDAAEDVWF